MNRERVLVSPRIKGSAGAEGQGTYTWPTAYAVLGNVQPYTLSEGQREAWGVSTVVSGAKKLFVNSYERYYEKITEFARVTYQGKAYAVRGVSKWIAHGEYILVPVQG